MRTILAIVAAFLWVADANAVITVQYSAGTLTPNRDVVDSGSTQLAIGNTVSIGYFDGGFDPDTEAGNLTSLLSSWNEVHATAIGSGSGIDGQDTAGHFGGTYNGGNGGVEQGQALYLLIYQTNDDSAFDPGTDNQSKIAEYGLFRGNTDSEDWVFPSDGASNTLTITSDDVTNAYWGAIVAGSPGSIQLAAVPEPEEYAYDRGACLGRICRGSKAVGEGLRFEIVFFGGAVSGRHRLFCARLGRS